MVLKMHARDAGDRQHFIQKNKRFDITRANVTLAQRARENIQLQRSVRAGKGTQVADL